MPPFDPIIARAARDSALGEAAGPLVREASALIDGDGLDRFLDRFRAAGMGGVVATWLGRSGGQPLTADQVEDVLGALPVTDIAGRVGLNRERTGTALGQIIPEIVGALTRPDAAAATGSHPGGSAAPAESSADAEETTGRWALPMIAAVLGLVLIAWLMRPAASGHERHAPTAAKAMSAPRAPAGPLA
jgi:uncharacterized protein YidB (DUF937 family)